MATFRIHFLNCATFTEPANSDLADHLLVKDASAILAGECHLAENLQP